MIIGHLELKSTEEFCPVCTYPPDPFSISLRRGSHYKVFTNIILYFCHIFSQRNQTKYFG
jgi:hypothetical protein